MQKSERSTSQTSPTKGVIEIRVRDVSDLLVASPPPFKGAVLTPYAERYIVREAKQVPFQQPIHLVIERGKPLGVEARQLMPGHSRAACETAPQHVSERLRRGLTALLLGLRSL